MKFTYLMVNLLTILFPFIFSFSKRLGYFYAKWSSLFIAMGIVGVVFIVWDIVFTKLGVWYFSSSYTLGINIFELPLEEWLFFVCIPYASVFLYHSVKELTTWRINDKLTLIISTTIVIGGIFISVLNTERIYTFLAFALAALLVLFNQYIIKARYLGIFYLSYLIVFIPFLIVNGILTGSFLSRIVVGYNNLENLGIRILTIPVEDSVYGFSLILGIVTLFEYFQLKGSVGKK